MDERSNDSQQIAENPSEARHIAATFGCHSLCKTSLSSVWNDLAAGRWRIRFSFVTRQHLGFVLEASRPGPQHEAASYLQSVRILQSCLRLASQKVVADEFGLATSTIATRARSCMRTWGLSCRPAHAPTLLALAACASEADPIFADECFGAHPETGVSHRVLLVSRPENELESLLTPAQFEVVSLLAEGYAHAELAALRRRSPRTVANQLASIYQRLRISGRAELLVQLAERAQATLRVSAVPAL